MTNRLMDIEDIRQKLKPYNLTVVAAESGVDKHTLYRLMNEHSKPAYETVKKIIEWLGEDEYLEPRKEK